MLIDDWMPVTSDFGLIEADLQQATEAYAAWYADLGRPVTRSEHTTLHAALRSLPPLSSERVRSAWVPTRAKWTAFFQSGIDGSDPFPAMSYLARTMGVRAMRVCSVRSPYRPAGTVWEVYAPPSLGGVEPLCYRRSIAATLDGRRWTFDQRGAPFEFERVAAYSAKRIRDRFTHDLLVEYLERFALTPFEDEFYAASARCPAVSLTHTHRWAALPREFTLAEVHAGAPWKPA